MLGTDRDAVAGILNAQGLGEGTVGRLHLHFIRGLDTTGFIA